MVKTKYELLVRDFFTCQRCGTFGNMDTLQRAHQVRQGKQSERFVKEFIKEKYNITLSIKDIRSIIDDEENIRISCPDCNDSFNMFYNQELRDEKITNIYEKNFMGKVK